MNAQDLFKAMQPYLVMAGNSVIEADMPQKEKQAAIGAIIGHFLGVGAHILKESGGFDGMELHELMELQLGLVAQGITKEALDGAKEDSNQG